MKVHPPALRKRVHCLPHARPKGVGLVALTLLTGLAGMPAAAQMNPRVPQRIVTLSPSLTDAVCALGYCAQLVGTDRYSDNPNQAASLPKLGGLADVQIERIVTLRPDMVLLGPRSRAGERLTALGVPVQVFDARTHADLKHTLLALGQLLGVPTRAAELIQRMDKEIDAAARRVPLALRGRSVYIEVGSGPNAASEKSFIGETAARLGLVNVVGSDMGLFPKINPEMIVRRAPDLIIGPRASLIHVAERPGWSDLPALRQQQICMLDDARWELISRPGPRLGDAAHLLADCLVGLPPARR
jgi:iron complex transport system substrate-binding protein